MRVRWMLVSGATAIAGIALVLQSAVGQAVTGSVTASAPNTAGVTTVTVKPDGSGATIKDVHITPGKGFKFPETEGGTNVTVTPADPPDPDGDGPQADPPAPPAQTWKVSKRSDGTIVVHTDNGSNAAGTTGEFSFPIDFKTDPALGGTRSCNYVVTNDGTKNPPTTGTTVFTDGSGRPACDLPKLTASLNGGDDKLAAIGNSWAIPLVTEPTFVGGTYTIYSSLSVNEEGTDPHHVYLNTASAPVPPAWLLSWEHATGLILPTGTPAEPPALTVPNNPELGGCSFYIAFLVETPSGARITSAPIRVTLQP